MYFILPKKRRGKGKDERKKTHKAKGKEGLKGKKKEERLSSNARELANLGNRKRRENLERLMGCVSPAVPRR